MENKPNKTYGDIEFLAKLMDDQFELFGFRFGLNILDIVPGIGDVAATVIALYIFSLTMKYPVSGWTRFRMLWNIAFAYTVALIPGIGDWFLLWYKPNRRNLRLLQRKVN